MTPKIQKQSVAPDQQVLNKVQQKRLATLVGIEPKELAEKTVAQLKDHLQWRVDPQLFLFRRICGKVVKKDPITGVEYPVPFATVYVEDTDCSFITYSPPNYNWCWHFPIFCHREILATVTTDACGNFCAWIPNFDIDVIVTWLHERFCYPIIFRRPTLGDLIPYFPDPKPIRWPHGPGPDPGPLDILTTLPSSTIQALAGTEAGRIATDAARVQNSKALTTTYSSDALNKRVFGNEMPPPLPTEFHKLLAGQGVVASEHASALEAVRSHVAGKVGLQADTREVLNFHPLQCIGPFYRCIDVEIPIWQIIRDIPDITFRVTQDINGDGVEETIYSESFFDVRWDSGPIPDITLVASSDAKESRACHIPSVPCGDVPAIKFAGLMELASPYFDPASGYALETNRPKPLGLPRGNAQTPFYGYVQLYGCVAIGNAQYYRILQSIDNGVTFSPVPLLHWNNYVAMSGVAIPIVPDAAGWYAVNPINPFTLTAVPRNTLEFPNWILDWPTQNGKTIFKIELGDAGKNHISYSADVAIVGDNTAPNPLFTQLAWKFVGEPESALRNLLGIPCPLIQRGTIPRDIEVVFEVQVSAIHLRDTSLATSGCGGGSFSEVTTDPLNNNSHWYTVATDNTVLLHQRYTLDHGARPGCYSFSCFAASRAMNPSGADGGNILGWDYDTNPPNLIYVDPSISVAVVNEG